MRYCLILVILFMSSVNMKAAAQDASTVDEIIRRYPRSFSNVQELAKRINEDFYDPVGKARAAYAWIAQNISYDVKTYFSGKTVFTYSYASIIEKKNEEKAFRIRLADETLESGKAVCEGYASLFKRVCDLTGLNCVIIKGIAKTKPPDIGKRPKGSNHTWNAVEIDGIWRLVDVTWGAGNVDYNKKIFIPDYCGVYFFTPPEKFFLKHFPLDNRWLLTNRTIDDFIDLPLYYDQYLRLDMDIVSPVHGILKISKNQRVRFRVRNIPSSSVMSYAFSNNKLSQRISLKKINGTYRFEIPVSLRRHANTFLTLFLDGKAIVTYKIIRA